MPEEKPKIISRIMVLVELDTGSIHQAWIPKNKEWLLTAVLDEIYQGKSISISSIPLNLKAERLPDEQGKKTETES